MLSQLFFQVTLPVMITIIGTAWVSIYRRNRRLENITHASRLGRIEDRLLAIETRLTAVEKKLTPLELKAWR